MCRKGKGLAQGHSEAGLGLQHSEARGTQNGIQHRVAPERKMRSFCTEQCGAHVLHPKGDILSILSRHPVKFRSIFPHQKKKVDIYKQVPAK